MICDSCGYKNDDNAKNCRGCGIVLKTKISDKELTLMLNQLSDRSDTLTASRIDKISGLVFFSLSPIILLICLIFSAQPAIGVIAAILAVVGGIAARYPKVIWELNKLRLSLYVNEDDITPTDFWSFMRKIFYWVLFVFTIVLALISLLMG